MSSRGCCPHHSITRLAIQTPRSVLELAQWIYSLGGVDHHAHEDEAWRQALQSLDDGPVIRYLLELGIPEQVAEAVPADEEDIWATIKAWQRDRRLKSARSRDLSVEEDR